MTLCYGRTVFSLSLPMRPSSLVPHNSGHGNEFGNPGRPSSKGRGLPYSENCPICDQGKETIKVLFI
jgi:hypothetical protein